MKKSLLALFAAAALSSGMAMAVDSGTTLPSGEIIGGDPIIPTVTPPTDAGATFQWSGSIPERAISNVEGLYIKVADGSRDFLDGALVFSNEGEVNADGNSTGKDKISLTDSTSLSFEVHSDPDTESHIAYDWELRTIHVGVNEAAPALYQGTFFDIAANDVIVKRKETKTVADADKLIPTSLKVVSRYTALENNVPGDVDQGSNDIASTFKALDTVVVQAAIVVKATGGFAI